MDHCNEYLTVAKFRRSILFQMMYWTFWGMNHLSTSSNTGVMKF